MPRKVCSKALKAGINKATMQNTETSNHRDSVSDTNDMPSAPLPSNVSSIRDALFVAGLCKQFGFAGPNAEQLCQQFNTKLDEVRVFASWADKYLTDEVLGIAPTLEKSLDSAQARLQEARAELSEVKAELKERTKALDEGTKELIVRKKLEELLSK